MAKANTIPFSQMRKMSFIEFKQLAAITAPDLAVGQS